jgi:flagellin-specific chaperone FliS
MEKYITLAKILDDVYNYFVEENVEFDLQDGTEEEIIKNIIDLIEKLIERKED